MASPSSVRVPACVFWPLLSAFFAFLYVSLAADLSLVVSESTLLRLMPSLTVQNSPGTKPAPSEKYERVRIHGLPRLKGLKKFAHAVEVKVLQSNSSIDTSTVEVCFYRNMSLGIGMCPQGHWEKLSKGLWIRSMSPFDNKVLDVHMVGSVTKAIEVSIKEEFSSYRLILLAIGVAMWTLAPTVSKSPVFYYTGAMAVGVILLVLVALFQGMRLLPTGRKSSLGFASIAGLGSFFLRYVPRQLPTILVEIGISEDMYYPLAMLMLVFIFLLGAWLGFWFVRKLVLADDGSVDISTSNFVAWSIRILGAVMILQATVDHVLALEALVVGILVSSILRRLALVRFPRKLYRILFRRRDKSRPRRSHVTNSLPFEDSRDGYLEEFEGHGHSRFLSPTPRAFAVPSGCTVEEKGFAGSARSPPSSQSLCPETYYSTFHKTHERRKFSEADWKKITKDSTKEALQGLVSSPDFNKWAGAHAERLTLRPEVDSSNVLKPRRRWFFWF